MKIPYNEYYTASHNDLPGELSHGRMKAVFKRTDKEDEVRFLIYIRLYNPDTPSKMIKVYSDERHTLEELNSLLWGYNFVGGMFVYSIMARLKFNEELREESEDYGFANVLDSLEVFLDTGYDTAVRELLANNNKKANGTTL